MQKYKRPQDSHLYMFPASPPPPANPTHPLRPLAPFSPFYRPQVIHIQQVHAFPNQHVPNMVPKPHRPVWRIPIANFQSSSMCAPDLAPYKPHLSGAKAVPPHTAYGLAERDGCIRGCEGGVDIWVKKGCARFALAFVIRCGEVRIWSYEIRHPLGIRLVLLRFVDVVPGAPRVVSQLIVFLC